MPEIKITISPANASRLAEAFESFFPIPQINNPEYEEYPQPANPSDNPSDWYYDYDFETPEYIGQYTHSEWTRLKIREYLRNTTERYERRRDMNIAKNAVNVPDNFTS